MKEFTSTHDCIRYNVHHVPENVLNKMNGNLSISSQGSFMYNIPKHAKTRSSWLNCALRDDEAVRALGQYKTL